MYTSEYPIINVTVDAVVSHYDAFEDKIFFLLIERKAEPFKNTLALPGGFLNPDETAEEAVVRELEEETSLKFTGALKALSPRTLPERDPRGSTISLPYLIHAQSRSNPKAGDDAASAGWWPSSEVLHPDTKLAFDHKQIILEALEHIL